MKAASIVVLLFLFKYAAASHTECIEACIDAHWPDVADAYEMARGEMLERYLKQLLAHGNLWEEVIAPQWGLADRRPGASEPDIELFGTADEEEGTGFYGQQSGHCTEDIVDGVYTYDATGADVTFGTLKELNAGEASRRWSKGHGIRNDFTEEDVRFLARPCYVNKDTSEGVPEGYEDRYFRSVQDAIDACPSASIVIQRTETPYVERLHIEGDKRLNLLSFDRAEIQGEEHVMKPGCEISFVGLAFSTYLPNAKFMADAPEE